MANANQKWSITDAAQEISSLAAKFINGQLNIPVNELVATLNEDFETNGGRWPSKDHCTDIFFARWEGDAEFFTMYKKTIGFIIDHHSEKTKENFAMYQKFVSEFHNKK